jgi:hypothetical protein
MTKSAGPAAKTRTAEHPTADTSRVAPTNLTPPPAPQSLTLPRMQGTAFCLLPVAEAYICINERTHSRDFDQLAHGLTV